MNSTEGLIKKLAATPSVSTRDFSPLVRTTLSIVLFFPVMALALFLIRPYEFAIQNPMHGFEILSFSLLIMTLTYFGFKAFVPGERLKKSLWMVLGSAGLMLVVFTSRLVESQTFNEVRPFCEVEAIVISVITTFLAHMLLKRNEYALNTPFAKSIFLSLPMMATVMLHGVCSLQAMHVIICHVVSPLMVPVGYLLYRRRLSRNI